MKILFTGASSFSGMWFLKELVGAGHEITAIFRRPLEAYEGIRRKRIDKILKLCKPIFQTSFGDQTFLSAIKAETHWDLFCHHAADVSDYKNPSFNVAAAVANNTNQIKSVLEALKAKGCCRMLLSGSVFEQNEGAGSDHLRAVSAYGLSKGLTSDLIAFYTAQLGVQLQKFVIPNPFGAYEEGRFTTYLIQNWMANKTAFVNTPLYIRDNIPVNLLAKAYERFAGFPPSATPMIKYNPSYYVESQGAFAGRLADEMRTRLDLPCSYALKMQMDFNEPLVRINTDRIDTQLLAWNESFFWDELAEFYKSTFPVCQTT